MDCILEVVSNDPDEPAVPVHVQAEIQIPDFANSYVEWVDLWCADRVLVCPEGDGSALSVYVRDDLGSPIRSAQIVPSFVGSCDLCVCEPIAAATAWDGTATLPIRAGLDATGGPDCCEIGTRVKCAGQPLRWRFTGGAITDVREWLSPDLNGDCVVNELDQMIFAADFGTDACRTDYNCNGSVETMDFALWNPHVGHECEPVTGIDDDSSVSAPALAQNYPNPFNPSTKIAFTLVRPGEVNLTVHDLTGRPVRRLLAGWTDAGDHAIVWDGRNENGEPVASGVYFYRMETHGRLEAKKMVLLR